MGFKPSRWNAFVADPPDDLEEYPVDISGITPIQALPNIPDEGAPEWPGPDSELEIEAPIDAHVSLDRGGEGKWCHYLSFYLIG
jgi:hypothetical protein